jgi:hypothetical protein
VVLSWCIPCERFAAVGCVVPVPATTRKMHMPKINSNLQSIRC